jgi:hypothetical protein
MEERLRAALDATANMVSEDTLRPLVPDGWPPRHRAGKRARRPRHHDQHHRALADGVHPDRPGPPRGSMWRIAAFVPPVTKL